MRTALRALAEQYSEALAGYFKGLGEEALLRAYELGRQALAEDLSVLELAALHQEAVVSALLKMLTPVESARIAKRATEFFAESLAPFEMKRLGTQEANVLLRDLNKELEERVRVVLDEFKAAQQQLDEHKRMERLKNEFISVVSHELRTPLTSIHGSLGLMSSGRAGELPPEAKQLVDVAYRNSQRLVRLVNDILDLQKIESGSIGFDLRPLDVASILEQAIEVNEAYGQKFGIRFVIREVPRRARVRGDSDGVMQVLTNLLSNAAKVSPAGQEVVVSARRRSGDIRVLVADRGPGIPEGFRERIFEKFVQADTSPAREKGGSGLGLSIAKAIVERMGGRIGFETGAGAGTTFYFDLPEWGGKAPLREADGEGVGLRDATPEE